MGAARAVRVLALLLAGIAVGCSNTPTAASPTAGASSTVLTPSPASSPAATAEPTGPTTVGLDEIASLELVLDRGPDFPTELDGSLWILMPDVGEPAVLRVDPETGTEQARVAVEGRLCQGIVAAFDALWACSDSGMVRIDPATNQIAARIEFPAARVAGRLAAGDGAIWSIAGNVFPDSVVRIDPATNQVAATHALGHDVAGIAFASDVLWATSPRDGLLLRLDAASGELTTALVDLPGPTMIAAGQGSVWVILYGPEGPERPRGAAALLRYDPESGQSTLFDVGSSPGGSGDLLVAETVWVRGSDPFLVELDPETGGILRAISEPGTGDGSLGLVAGRLWATSIDRGRVWRIDL